MYKLLYFTLLLIILFVGAHAKDVDTVEHVNSFVQLLIREKPPTLAEYAKYVGECGGESELNFTLNQCQLKGWDIYSKSCIDFSKHRCQNSDKEISLSLMWIRDSFSTTGERYNICSIKSVNNGFLYEIIKIKIGKNNFKLFHNLSTDISTGLLIDVIEINGLKISDYEKKKNCNYPLVPML